MKTSLASALAALAVLATTAHAQTVSLMDAPPPQSNISQPIVFNTLGTTTAEITEGEQARYQSAGTNVLRAVSQTFTWKSDNKLTAIGIMVAPDQNTVGGCAFSADQQWAFDVQELDTANKVVSMVTSATVTLTPSVVQPGKYIHVVFDAAKTMTNGKSYGIHIRPVEVTAANRLLVATSGRVSQGGVGSVAAKYDGIGMGNQTAGYYDNSAAAYTASPAGWAYANAASGGVSIVFYTVSDAIAPELETGAPVTRVVYSQPSTYFTYPHENGFWKENASAPWTPIVTSQQGDGKLRLNQLDPNPAAPTTKPLLVTEGMRIYYVVAEETGLVYYTKQTNSSGTPPAMIYEGNLQTGDNRLVYQGPEGWQISQSCNITNDGAYIFARIYNISDNTDNKVLRIKVADGTVETLVSPPFLSDHVHCSPFDNNWVEYCNAGEATVTLDRMWAWHETEAPEGRQLFAQKDSQNRDLYTGHERALYNRRTLATVVFPHSPGSPRGLYEVGFDRSIRCVSEDPMPGSTGDSHCNISRDGRWAVMDTLEAGQVSHIYAINFSTGARVLLCKTSITEHPWHPHPHISPDNKWIIFNDSNLKKVVALEIDQTWLDTFAAVATPAITNFTPSEIMRGGQIKIQGTNLNNVTAVKFGDVDAASFSVNDVCTEITAVMPETAPDTGKINITAENGAVESTTNYVITIIPPPDITGFTPTDVATGTVVTINGTNFTDVTSVKIGDIEATSFTVNSEKTQITATVPPGIPDTGVITVTAAGGITSSTASLAKLTGPSRFVALTAQTVVAGHDLTLNAIAAGNPAPHYTWEMLAPGAATDAWTAIEGTDLRFQISSDGGVLRILSVDTSLDGAKFRFTAYNGIGSEVTAGTSATLTVDTLDRFPSPVALAIAASGDLYVADDALSIIQRITTTGTLEVFTGSPLTIGTTNGTGIAALFNTPAGLDISEAGELLVADSSNNNLRAITARAVTRDFATGLNAPVALASDLADNIYVADTGNHVIRMVSPGGQITTIAGKVGEPDNAGAIGATVTGSNARFHSPAGIAVGASGNIYVADTGNHVIRAISPIAPWNVTTVAGISGSAAFADGLAETALFNAPRGLADDVTTNAPGAIYIADTDNSLIRRLDIASMTVTTVAGRPGTAPSHGFLDATGTTAWFDHPRDVVSNAAGVLYVADTGNAAVRKIAPDKTVTTLAPVPEAAAEDPGGDPGNDINPSKDPKGGGAPSFFLFAALSALTLARLFIKKKYQ